MTVFGRGPGTCCGFATSDAIMILSLVCLAGAIAYPRVQESAFRTARASTIASVEAVQKAMLEYRTDVGAWPSESTAGTVPAELAGRLPPSVSFTGPGFALSWQRWEVVEAAVLPVFEAQPIPTNPDQEEIVVAALPEAIPPAIREFGALALHSGDLRLQSELLDHFGRATSFVRDSTWVLVFPQRASPSQR